MKTLITTFIALTVLLSCNSLATKKVVPMPADFNFKYVFDDTEIISTFDSTYQRHYMFHDTVISLRLTTEEKQRIYAVMVDNNVFEMPDDFENDSGATCIVPSPTDLLFIEANHLKKKIKYDYQCPPKDAITAQRYLVIIKTIKDILINKKEVQQLPAANMLML